MSRSIKFIVLSLLGMMILVVLFWQPISRFLFHPEGLSTAAAEICVQNKTDKGIVADVTVQNGARSLTYLTSDEIACAAAPETSSVGMVKVSLAEGEGP
ncbi:MAG: hypothetical protein WBC71_15535, partial [Salaquimonas sp.]